MVPHEILTEELRGQAVPMALLSVLLTAVLVWSGHEPVQTAYSALAGCLYALFNFCSIGRTSLYAVQQTEPVRAVKLMTAGFMRRYLLTTVYLAFVFLSGVMNAAAATAPLLFSKVTVLARYAARKEGKG